MPILDDKGTIGDVNRHLKEEGIVSYFDQRKEMPVREAANDPNVKALINKIDNGEATACSPCRAMYEPVTSEEDAAMDAALDRVFGAK